MPQCPQTSCVGYTVYCNNLRTTNLCQRVIGISIVRLTYRRFRVFTVPEAATSMFSNGIDFTDLGSQENRFAFQWGILS